MRSITFDYSLDGTNFTDTPISIRVLTARCYLMPYSETESNDTSTMDSTSIKCQKYTARLNVDIVVSPLDLDPAENANGNANLKFLQYWACAPWKRIYNASVGTMIGLDGWTEFDASNNTNYLILRSDPTYEFTDTERRNYSSKATTRSIRKVKFALETRSAVAIDDNRA